MPKATFTTSSLTPITDCYIDIPGAMRIVLDNLPEISDTKSANYADEIVIGRSSPIKTYSQSDNRTISMQLHFIISKPEDVEENLRKLRAIQSAAYPRNGEGNAPFIPPPVCKIKCGKLLAESEELCVILKNYSVKFPTEVSWVVSPRAGASTDNFFTPMKFDVDTSWDVVYASSQLPGQEKIFSFGK